MSSPVSCFLFSQFAIRPRPDHVSLVVGSRYLGWTKARLGLWTAPLTFPASAGRVTSALCTDRAWTSSSTGRFRYAMLLLVIPTSSHPSAPALLSMSSSSLRGRCSLRLIFRYFHTGTARISSRTRYVCCTLVAGSAAWCGALELVPAGPRGYLRDLPLPFRR